jgi:hypothetical protein
MRRILFSAIVALCAILNAHAQSQLLSSAFAWWSGDNTADETFTGIGATPVNGAGFANGIVGEAFNFNGNGQYFSVPDSDEWNLGAGDFTIELWARFNTDISGRDAIFIAHDEGCNNLNKWFFGRYIGYLLFHVNGPSGGFFPLVDFRPTPREWHHLAITRQGSTFTIYVNGSIGGSATHSQAIPNPNVPLTIGWAEGCVGDMDGQLDEITMYHRALSADEIRSIFKAGSSGKYTSVFVESAVIPAQTNQFLSFQLQARYGSPPYNWSLSEGRLPNGITLSDSGMLQGTPTETGEFRFGVSVSDATNAVASGYSTIRIPIPPVPYPAPSDAVAWWPFEEAPDSSTLADRVGNNTAAKANGPTVTLGKIGQALRFNGVDQYLSVQNSAAFQFGTNDFSFETWARFDAGGGGSMGEPSHILIGSSDGPGSANKWFFALGGGVLNFHINGSGGSAFYPLGSFSPVVGEWYHLAVVREGNTLRSYVNGNTNGFATNIINVPATTAPVTIGQSEFIGLFNGAIDEPTVYRRALRAEEVKAIFNADTAGKTVELSIKPMYGGTNGTVTVHLDGIGFKQGATVQLIRAGQTNIVGDPVTVATNGMSIDTTFDLHGTTPLICDVLVSNLDGTTFPLPGGFTIQPSSTAKVWVDVVGLGLIRPGRAQTFHIFYGNNGNVDAVGVPLVIAGIPTNAIVKLGFDVLPPREFEPNVDYTIVPNSIDVGSEIVVPLRMSTIPAGFAGALALTITIPTAENFTLRAWANPPLFGSPADEEILDCYIAIGGKIAGTIVDNGCAVEWSKDLHKWLLYQGSGKAINWTWDILDLVTKCVPNFACQLCVGGKLTPSCVVCVATTVATKGREIWSDAQDVVTCGKAALHTWEKSSPVSPVNSFDPNDQMGPIGIGDLRYLSGLEPLHYVVSFENHDTATAPAQEVIVKNILDPYKVDVNSVQLSDIHVGTNLISVPAGVHSFSTVLDLRTNQNLLVAIDCNLDPNTSTLNWHFRSLDPLTMQPPDDPLAGFLPPNTTPPNGEGSVGFSVSPRDSIATGTMVTNFASITFDNNPPIDTPVWTNAFDFSSPSIHVAPLRPLQVSDKFELKWGSADTGSGVDRVGIEMSTNNTDFVPILQTSSAVSLVVTGQVNTAYQFRFTVSDAVGHLNQTVVATDGSLLATKITALTTNYMSWAQKYFGQSANDPFYDSTLWGMAAIPSGQGSPNLFRWYYNESPLEPESDTYRAKVTLNGLQPQLSFIRRKISSGVRMDVLSTTGLRKPWQVITAPSDTVIIAVDDQFEQVAWALKAESDEAQFLRLQISVNDAP